MKCSKCGSERIPSAAKPGERYILLVDTCPYCGYVFFEGHEEKVKL